MKNFYALFNTFLCIGIKSVSADYAIVILVLTVMEIRYIGTTSLQFKLTKPILAHSITNMKPSLCVLFTVDQYKAVLLHICRICVNNASFSVLK